MTMRTRASQEEADEANFLFARHPPPASGAPVVLSEAEAALEDGAGADEGFLTPLL